MNTRQTAWLAIATLTAAALGFAGARAMATGAPQLSPLTYGGVLTDKDGKPYPSAQEVVLKFYDKVDATAPKCTAPAAQAEAGNGRFSVVLPGECAQAVRDTPDLWSEATVGGGKTVLPRVHVGAVPYALEADSAKVAGSAGAASGALKVAMDGVVADVAALKKAPAGGGAPKVVDGAGVVLGTLTAVDDNYMHLLTNQGYALIIDPKGYVTQYTMVYYGSADCTGQAYRFTNLAKPPETTGTTLYSRQVGTVATLPSGNWYVDELQPNGVATATYVAIKSSYWVGGCKVQSFSGTAYPLKTLTPTQAGLPDNITAPLKIVP